MYDSKGYIAGAKRRLEKARKMLPDGYVLVRDLADEAFELFKDLFSYDYGSIDEDENLISIHTGGFSENEELISELKETGWWIKNYEITAAGGHYYFNTDFMDGIKSWDIRAVGENEEDN